MVESSESELEGNEGRPERMRRPRFRYGGFPKTGNFLFERNKNLEEMRELVEFGSMFNLAKPNLGIEFWKDATLQIN